MVQVSSHMPKRLRVPSTVGAPLGGNQSMFLFLSPSPSDTSPLSKTNKRVLGEDEKTHSDEMLKAVNKLGTRYSMRIASELLR